MNKKSPVFAGLVLAHAVPMLASAAAWSQETVSTAPVPKSVAMVRAESRPLIDGKLDDAAWAQAARIEDFHQIRPGNQTPPSERTEVYLLYDKDAIYVAARMWDSGAPGQITRNIMKQGSSLGEDDRLAIVIDPFNSRRQGYRFEVNANGVRNDMLYQNNQLQSEWTVIWEAAGDVGEGFWTAELAIPFKSLPFDSSIESWGFNVSRAIRRRGEEMLWVSRNRTWNPGIVGVASGLRGMDQGAGLDIVPGLSVKQARSYTSSSSALTSDPSLEVYYKITPALTGSLTVNTDFSATEVDDRQVNLTRFNLFFPEKRDFFLSDADLFEFGRIGAAGFLLNNRSVSRTSQENGRPFFSRRVGLSSLGTPVDLEYGGKLAGRIGRFNIGALAVRQDEFVYPNGTTVEPTNALVSRVTANVLEESTVGMIATSGNPTSNLDNSLVGADFLFLNSRFAGGRTLEGDLWFQRSQTEGIRGDDSAFGVGMRMPNSSGLRGGVGLRQIEKNFFPALGFVSRTNVRDTMGDFGFTRIVGGRIVQSLYAGLDAERVTSLTDGEVDTQIIAFRPLELETRGRDLTRLVATANDERVLQPFAIYASGARRVVIEPGKYSFNDYGLDIATGPQRKYAGKLSFRKGDFYNGERVNLGGEFVWKQSRHFTLRLAYDWNDVELPQGRFITRLARTTSEVSLSSRVNWISLFQYDDVSEVFGIQSRLAWIPKAGQEMFLVFNRSFQDFDKDGRLQSVNSELSAKVSYTFRF
jgi:hypothetical protein